MKEHLNILAGNIKMLIVCISVQLAVSCKQSVVDNYQYGYSPAMTEVLLSPVLLDSLVIPVDEKKLKSVKAGRPSVVHIENNTHPAGSPKIMTPVKPKINIPGTDSFHSPHKIPVLPKPVKAGAIKLFPVKEMSYKNPNPSSFSYFGKFHGLKHAIVTSLLQDNLGNVWICTAGGVTKYDGHSFTNFTQEQGLCKNDVRSVLQDKNGNIWMGTLGGGISKYDGYTFTNFSTNDGLCNDNVVDLVEDKQGNIWMATWGGLVKYDGNSIINYTQKEGLVNNFVQAVEKDKQGNIWIGTDKGVSKFDGISFTNFTEKEGLLNSDIYAFCEDNKGNIWIGSEGGGAFIYDGKSFTNFTTKEGLVNNDVYSIIEYRDGSIWLGTHYGLSKYDGVSFTNFREKQGLTNDNIYCILEDKQGLLWVGTAGGGVLKHNPYSFTHITANEGLPQNYIFSAFEDKQNKLWFGTWRGGLYEYENHVLKIFTKQQGLPDNDIRSICQDREGNIWLATFKGIVKYDGNRFTWFTEKDGLCNNDANIILEDSHGNIWIGAAGGISKYNGHSFTNFFNSNDSVGTVYCIKQDRTDNLWVGASGGIFKYDGRSFFHLKNNDGSSVESSVCIYEDNAGQLWFGTENGIIRYDRKKATRLTTREGLVHNEVTGIIGDDKGNFWISTRFGLSKLDAKKSALLNRRLQSSTIYESDVFFTNFRHEEDFIGIGVANRSIILAHDRRLWFGTNGGITSYNPAKEIKDTLPPSIHISAVKISGQTINWANLHDNPDTSFLLNNGVWFSRCRFTSLSRLYNLPEGLSLAYNNNDISFDLVGITTTRTRDVKYQYQLEPLNKKMSRPTDQSNVSYGNLPPGKYTFKVKAIGYYGNSSDEYRYNFIIRPPWWQTWWFRTLAITAFLMAVFFTTRFIYTYKLRRQKILLEKELAIQYERQRISADLHDEIGSTLSSINIYTGLAKRESGKEIYLESISQNVNEVVNNLDDLVWSINPKYDTLANVLSRLLTYAEPLAAAKAITLHLRVEENIKSLKPPAETKHHLLMILKELLNNAVKHSGCKNIYIEMQGSEKLLKICLSDDGSGFDKTNTGNNRNGLGNLIRRAEAIKGTLHIETAKGYGTKITLTITMV